MPDCIFCKIVSGVIPSYKIYENDKLLVFLDIVPVNPGHVLIIPKKHFADMVETPDELLSQMIILAKKIGAKIIKSKLGEGFNIGINTKAVAGQVVNHFHIHIMPRLSNDNYELWHGKNYATGEAEKVVKKLRLEL